MDFNKKLPQTIRGHESIWVVVNCLTKYARFIPIKNLFVDRLADVYFNEVVKFHGIPTCIVSDRDSRFTSRYW